MFVHFCQLRKHHLDPKLYLNGTQIPTIGETKFLGLIFDSKLSFIPHITSLKIQNLFLTAQSMQIKSVISVPIKDFIHHYPRALFNDIPRVGAYFYDIPGSGRSFTTYPCRGAV